MSEELPGGGIELSPAETEALDARWSSCWTPDEVARQLAGVVTPQVLAFALLIGGVSLPGAFLARKFVERMPVHIHTAILDAAVITGGVVMISSAARHLL